MLPWARSIHNCGYRSWPWHAWTKVINFIVGMLFRGHRLLPVPKPLQGSRFNHTCSAGSSSLKSPIAKKKCGYKYKYFLCGDFHSVTHASKESPGMFRESRVGGVNPHAGKRNYLAKGFRCGFCIPFQGPTNPLMAGNWKSVKGMKNIMQSKTEKRRRKEEFWDCFPTPLLLCGSCH